MLLFEGLMPRSNRSPETIVENRCKGTAIFWIVQIVGDFFEKECIVLSSYGF